MKKTGTTDWRRFLTNMRPVVTFRFNDDYLYVYKYSRDFVAVYEHYNEETGTRGKKYVDRFYETIAELISDWGIDEAPDWGEVVK